jgi:hypothetical protein
VTFCFDALARQTEGKGPEVGTVQYSTVQYIRTISWDHQISDRAKGVERRKHLKDALSKSKHAIWLFRLGPGPEISVIAIY